MFKSAAAVPTVLVIEDEVTQQRLMEEQLKKLGMKVVLASNGQEGFELWQANKNELRIVITDLVMPLMDGFKVVEAIRKNDGLCTYIMVLTRLEDRDSILKAMEVGADDFVTKPVIIEELALRLKGAIRKLRLQENQLLVSGMAALAAERSGESEGHLVRTKEYCHILAKDMLQNSELPKLVSQFAEDVANLSVLHDIGKQRIPDNLLNKKGQYSAHEFEQVKYHTTLGAEIIDELYSQNGSSYLLLARDIVLNHHERWDGKGYPHGLQGEDISLAARIVGFADVYDSLLSRKPYKDPMPLEHVEKYIQEEKGKQFDPAVVECYEKNRDAFLEVMNRYPDGL